MEKSERLNLMLLFFVCTLSGSANIYAATEQFLAGASVTVTDSHIECDSPSLLKIEGVVRLNPGCIYTTTALIRRGDSELDCQGSIIDPGPLKGYAVLVDSGGQSMSNVTIRNCIIRNSNAIGIVVAWRASDRVKVEGFYKAEIYARSPRNIQIINTLVDNAAGAGIYIDDYVSDVILSNVSLVRSQAMGVYLEHSSRNITIENSLFEDNSWGKKREALAIDSSAGNMIRRNVFRRNKFGGIFLYKNCFEKSHTDKNQVARWQGANDNIIENNIFEDQRVGIWVASRQSLDLRKMDCGAPYYEGKFVLDFARGNSIVGNMFRRVAQGVVVEDDNNSVVENVFEQTREVCVRVGSGPRARFLNRPVSAVVVRSNQCDLLNGALGSTGVEYTHGSHP
ncbi:MAG: right-handed parallel beta-helix repeat-containing protein [bacterium]|nr:right-handed parallel beta-helix repeat-containing protein [bacterium]